MADANMTNRSMEQTEKQESTVMITLDSDNREGNTAGSKQLTAEKKKQLTTSELAGDKNNQIVPYGQSAASMNPLETSRQPSIQFERIVLQKRPDEERIQDLVGLMWGKTYQRSKRTGAGDQHAQAAQAASNVEKIAEIQVSASLSMDRKRWKSDDSSQVNGDAATGPRPRKRKVIYKPMEEEEKPKKASDGLEDLWNDFALAKESTKLDTSDDAANDKQVDNEKDLDNDCNHDVRVHEDLGHVCRVCGMIVRAADSIIDYQWKKASRARTSVYEARQKDAGQIDCGAFSVSEDFIVSDVAIHPRHAKKMRPHQLEGFSFLVKNLVTDNPGGCILAHAPGSGKTFMLISFIQSFMVRHPSARPLVVLPKGILGTWKKEFQRWQVEGIPLYDFYSVKADKRVEQLEVLKSWEAKISILFLGYTQFSRIVCDDGGGNVAAACRDRLLMVPNLLIMDEGHTPRNQDTNVLESLRRVKTPRKVVLSGTLFQNHVEEVFNILNLVRPKFLRMESSRPIVRRILSQAAISGGWSSKGLVGSAFTESVENTLLNDDNFRRKAHVIRSLRELTKDVLHYYKGDILDELPGLVDFSVFLELTPKQKDMLHKIEAYGKFKRSAVGTALYIHPCLSELSEGNAVDRANNLTDATVDSSIRSIKVGDGVKARFFLNILSLANSAGEKVLAFSQYILPMKFLERLLAKMRGWQVGKEIFVISGDTSTEDRELAMDRFNSSADAKVLFGSIKACGEGISLVGASRVVILDVHLNPSVTRQAIGRAFRPGQKKKVFVYRLVAADSPEEEFHETAFKKEVIPKLWFEWSEHCTTEDFELNQVDIGDSGDELLECKATCQDIKALYRRPEFAEILESTIINDENQDYAHEKPRSKTVKDVG